MENSATTVELSTFFTVRAALIVILTKNNQMWKKCKLLITENGDYLGFSKYIKKKNNFWSRCSGRHKSYPQVIHNMWIILRKPGWNEGIFFLDYQDLREYNVTDIFFI